jgi:hypothetical protein
VGSGVGRMGQPVIEGSYGQAWYYCLSAPPPVRSSTSQMGFPYRHTWVCRLYLIPNMWVHVVYTCKYPPLCEEVHTSQAVPHPQAHRSLNVYTFQPPPLCRVQDHMG